MITSKTIELLTKIEFVGSKQRWFSGRILACHAGGPGSIPGRCKLLIDNIFLCNRYGSFLSFAIPVCPGAKYFGLSAMRAWFV